MLPVRKKLTFSVVFTLIVLALSFAGLEGYVRATRPYVDLYVLTGKLPGAHPMAEWAQVDAFSAYRARRGEYGRAHARDGLKTVNSHGFISTPEIDYEKQHGELRIVFLGESSTAGTGEILADFETWPWKCTEILRARQRERKITFINGALGGYTSFESYGRLWSRLRFFEPDVVVVCHGWNEMYYFRDSKRVRNWRTGDDGEWGFTGVRTKVLEPCWIDRVLRHSQVLTRTRRKLAASRSGELGTATDGELDSEFDWSGAEVWRTNLRLIREACRLFDAELFVCRQATLVVPGLSESDRKRCSYPNHGFDHDAHVRAFQAIYQVIDDEIPARNVIDLTSISGRSEAFFDHVHPTPSGTTEIAQIVANIVGDNLIQLKE